MYIQQINGFLLMVISVQHRDRNPGLPKINLHISIRDARDAADVAEAAVDTLRRPLSCTSRVLS